MTIKCLYIHGKLVDPFVCIREEAPKYNKHLPLYGAIKLLNLYLGNRSTNIHAFLIGIITMANCVEGGRVKSS